MSRTGQRTRAKPCASTPHSSYLAKSRSTYRGRPLPTSLASASNVVRVLDLLGHYPNAKRICSVGPMMNDNDPPGAQHWTRMQKYVREMVDGVRAEGHSNVHYFAYTPIVGGPRRGLAPHQRVPAKMADALEVFLRELGF